VDFNLNSILPNQSAIISIQWLAHDAAIYRGRNLGSTCLNRWRWRLPRFQAYQGLFREGNTRPVQPLGDRIVLTDVPGFVTKVPEPQTYAMLLMGLCLLGFMSRQSRQA